MYFDNSKVSCHQTLKWKKTPRTTTSLNSAVWRLLLLMIIWQLIIAQFLRTPTGKLVPAHILYTGITSAWLSTDDFLSFMASLACYAMFRTLDQQHQRNGIYSKISRISHLANKKLWFSASRLAIKLCNYVQYIHNTDFERTCTFM